MSKKLYTVTIVSCETGNEYALIREALESYSVRVIHEPIGRPSDFIDFLKGETYFDSDFVVFAFHGEGGKFYMPVLGESVYEEDEPRGNFGVDEITRYCKIKTPTIVNLGCGLGHEDLANAFLASSCKTYIGAKDDIDGASSGFFALHLFYELCQNNRTLKEAFEKARSTDSETMLFEWFE